MVSLAMGAILSVFIIGAAALQFARLNAIAATLVWPGWRFACMLWDILTVLVGLFSWPIQ